MDKSFDWHDTFVTHTQGQKGVAISYLKLSIQSSMEWTFCTSLAMSKCQEAKITTVFEWIPNCIQLINVKVHCVCLHLLSCKITVWMKRVQMFVCKKNIKTWPENTSINRNVNINFRPLRKSHTFYFIKFDWPPIWSQHLQNILFWLDWIVRDKVWLTTFKNKFEVMIIPGLKANGDGRNNYLRFIIYVQFCITLYITFLGETKQCKKTHSFFEKSNIFLQENTNVL